MEGRVWKRDPFTEQVRDREVEAEVVGRDSILDLFQRSHGIRWDLLMDKMWDMKEGSERWLQIAGLTLNKEGDLYCHVRKLQEEQGWS